MASFFFSCPYPNCHPPPLPGKVLQLHIQNCYFKKMSQSLIQLVIESTSFYLSCKSSPLDLRLKYLTHAQYIFQLNMSKTKVLIFLSHLQLSESSSLQLMHSPFFHWVRSKCLQSSLNPLLPHTSHSIHQHILSVPNSKYEHFSPTSWSPFHSSHYILLLKSL